MGTLTVSFDDRQISLAADGRLTFGRDDGCDLCLDPDDFGISRVTGEVRAHDDGWLLANRSTKRTIHVVDDDNVAVPLPPALPPTSPVWWLVAGRAVEVVVMGTAAKHVIRLDQSPQRPQCRIRPASIQVPPLTQVQRRVGAALAEGYLRPWPTYLPAPRSYADVAAAVRLSEWRVIDEVGRLRSVLAAAQVLPAPGEVDPRRMVSEWLVPLGLVGVLDLPAAAGGGGQPRTTMAPSDLGAVAPQTDLPTTTHPLHDAVTKVAEATARSIAQPLGARLHARYGEQWRDVLRQQRPDVYRHRPSLRDYRFCLAVLAHDASTRSWVSEQCRRDARRLNGLANRAAHRRPVTSDDVHLARQLGARIRECFSDR